MTVTAVREALGDYLERTLDEVQVYRRVPASLSNVPRMLVARRGEYDAAEYLGGSPALLKWELIALSPMGDDSNLSALDDLVGEILEAIEEDGTLGGAVSSCVAVKVEPEDIIPVAGQQFYGCAVQVEVWV